MKKLLWLRCRCQSFDTFPFIFVLETCILTCILMHGMKTILKFSMWLVFSFLKTFRHMKAYKIHFIHCQTICSILRKKVWHLVKQIHIHSKKKYKQVKKFCQWISNSLMNYCVASCMGLKTISHREKNVLFFSREIDFFSKNFPWNWFFF